MPTDDILIRFKAETGNLKAEFEKVKESLKGVNTEQKKVADQNKKTSEQVKTSTKEITSEAEKLKSGNSALGTSFAKLGRLIAAAFSVQQVIAFGNTAVNEFAKAEKAAFQLLAALNGNTEAQKRLLDVADELQERFAIDNDIIVAQESFLAIQGRTESQIKKTIEAAIQLSAVTGEDLASAVQKLDGTFEGVTGRLGRLDSRISGLTKTQLANGDAIDIINEKYQGLAEKGLEGVAGELQRIAVESENAAERLGESIAPIKIFFQDAKKDILNFFATIIDGIKSFAGLSTANDEITKFKNEQLALSLKAFEDFNEEKLQRLLAADERELASAKNLSEKQKAFIEAEISALKQLILIREQDAEAAKKALLPTDEELKKISEAAAKELEARKQSTEALRKFTLQSLQDGITEKETARKLEIAKTITNEKKFNDAILQAEIETLEERRALLIEFGEPTADIEKRISDLKIEQIRKTSKEAKEIFEEDNKERAEQYDEDVENFKEAEIKKQEAVEETLDKISQSADAFNNILNSLTESQIQTITDATERQTENIEGQQERLQGLLDSHKISQEEFNKRSKALADSRARVEKQSQDKIKALKLEEAKREKLFTIFKIGLIIAEAIAALNFFKAAIAGAELIAVLAAPLPAFKKGTKNKPGSGLARVGEEGEEIMFVPSGAKILPAQKTRQYSDVLDSMFDGNLDKYIHEKYVLPALKQSIVVNNGFNEKKLAKLIKQRDSISIDNLHELAEMFDHNPRRVI